MKILPVCDVPSNKQYNIDNKIINNKAENQAYKPENLFRLYFGRDIVQTPPKEDFNTTIKENYFKLPAGCAPDEFQTEAAQALYKGKDVLVEAPTGTGKTAIAYYITSKNMQNGKTTFYTTPLKALSNQKLNEFKSLYGDENVGILTGDRRENTQAPVIIMTTEVYRNMALSNMYEEKNPLMENLATVIFDEFHYLGDNSRGNVWEESIMYTPKDVQTLELSATIGNASELKNWISCLKNDNTALVSVPSSARHVPLIYDSIPTSSYRAEEKILEENLKNGTVESMTYLPEKPSLSDYKFAVNKLNQKEQLPAIFFVFSRNFSRDLLEYMGQEGQDLTTDSEKEEIEKILDKYENNNYIGANLDIEALKKGYAVHNAGIIPKQKELIEELFQKKLIKVVIATETLAAGINMPAKTVVISSPYKPDNTSDNKNGLRMLTSNEFKQMSGRAGRRGIDTVGYVYTMPTGRLSEDDFLYLEAIDCNPIESKYTPSYDFLSGYYKYSDNNDKLTDIFDKTFYSYSEDLQTKKSKIQDLLDVSQKKEQVLLKRGILNQDENGKVSTNLLSDMASKVRGYDVLTLTETIADKNTFSNVSPAVLAMLTAAIANPANPGENEISQDTDLHRIFDSVSENVNKVYNRLNSSVNLMIKKTGKNPEKFNNLYEMLEYAENIEKSDNSLDFLKEEYLRQEEKVSKMYTITKTSGNYTLEKLVKSLQNGETVPSKVLEQYLDIVEKYKGRINSKTFNDYAEKIKAEIAKQDTSAKGNKAKARVERKISELTSELHNAEMMQYLDDNLIDAINSNYKFIKENPPKQVKTDFNNAKELYFKTGSKDVLISKIKALISMQKNMAEENKNKEKISADFSKAAQSFDNVLNKSLEIYATETESNIESYPQEYSETAAEVLYNWVCLNQMNPEYTIANWERMQELILPSDIDEGTMYRIIMQTADLLSQIGEMAETGMQEAENPEDMKYYSDLKENAKKTRDLIIKEPIEI